MSKFIKIADMLINCDNISGIMRLEYDEPRDTSNKRYVAIGQIHRIDQMIIVDSLGIWEVSKFSKNAVVVRHIDVDRFFDWITNALMDVPNTPNKFPLT